MDDSDVSLDSIEGSDEDELDPETADNDIDSIRSGGNREDKESTESLEEE